MGDLGPHGHCRIQRKEAIHHRGLMGCVVNGGCNDRRSGGGGRYDRELHNIFLILLSRVTFAQANFQI